MLYYPRRTGKTPGRQQDSMTYSAPRRGRRASHLDSSRRETDTARAAGVDAPRSQPSTIAYTHARRRMGVTTCGRCTSVYARKMPSVRWSACLSCQHMEMVKSTKSRPVRVTAREGYGAQGYARGVNATRRAKNGDTTHIEEGLS